MIDLHALLNDGTPVVFVGDAWDQLGPHFLRQAAEEDRQAQASEEETRAAAVHEAFFRKDAA